MKTFMPPGRSAWSLDLAEVSTFPGQPRAPQELPAAVNAAELDERAAHLDRLWRRSAAEASTSIVEVLPPDHKHVTGYLERRSSDRVRAATRPFSRPKHLNDWLGERPGPFLVALSERYPEHEVGNVFADGRRGQLLVMTDGPQGVSWSRSAQAVKDAIARIDASWVPDRVDREEGARLLLWAAGIDSSASEHSKIAARGLASLVGGRSAGLIPIGRWLRSQLGRGDDRPLKTAATKVEAILLNRFLTTLERSTDGTDLVGVCAAILLVFDDRSLVSEYAHIGAYEALIDLAMICDGPRIPLDLALRIMGRSDREAQTELHHAVSNLVELGLATTPMAPGHAHQRERETEFVSIAAAHQAALRLLNAPLMDRSGRRVVAAIQSALDTASDSQLGTRGEPDVSALESLVRHSLAACDAIADAGVPSLGAAVLMERALSLFSRIPLRSEHGEPGADELMDWGLDLAQRFLIETRARFGALSHETAVAARSVAWTRRNNGDPAGALEALEESKSAARYVGGKDGRRLKAQGSYLEGTVLVSANDVDRARAVFEELESAIFPDGISVEALRSENCPLDRRERVQLGSYLARIEMASGEIADARDRLDDLLYLARQAGSSREAVWNIQQNLGLALVLQGNVALAEKVLGEVYEARKRALGNDHPDTLQTRMTLARLELMRGQPLEAADLAREVASARAREIGSDAPATLASELFVIRAQLAAGIPCTNDARRLAARRHDIFGAHHASTQLAVRVVAQSLLLEGRSDEAIDVIAQIERSSDGPVALESSNSQPGMTTHGFEPDPFEKIELEHLLLMAEAGSARPRAKTWDQVADRLGALAKEVSSALGPLHPATLEIQASVAWAFAGGGRLDEARQVLEELLTRLPLGMATHPISVQARELQIMIAVQMEEVTRARRLLDELGADLEACRLTSEPATAVESDRRALEVLVDDAEQGEPSPYLLRQATRELERTVAARSHSPDEHRQVSPHTPTAIAPVDRLRAEGLLVFWEERTVVEAPADEQAVSVLRSMVYEPRLIDDRSGLPPVRRGMTLPSLDAPRAMRLGVQLLVDDAGLAVRRLADLAGISVSHVSNLLRSYEAAGLIRRSGRGARGGVDQQSLFHHLAAHWASFVDPDQAGVSPAGIALPISQWETLGGLRTESWALTGDRAAVGMGAPLVLSSASPYELHVLPTENGTPSDARLRRSPVDQIALAQNRYGAVPASAARTILHAPPMEFPTIEHPSVPELPMIRLVHPVIVALDLWASGDRGREAMQEWEPILDGQSWRVW